MCTLGHDMALCKRQDTDSYAHRDSESTTKNGKTQHKIYDLALGKVRRLLLLPPRATSAVMHYKSNYWYFAKPKQFTSGIFPHDRSQKMNINLDSFPELKQNIQIKKHLYFDPPDKSQQAQYYSHDWSEKLENRDEIFQTSKKLHALWRFK